MSSNTFNITNTFVSENEDGEFSASGEFVFTFGPVTVKIEYTVDSKGVFFIADVKYSYEKLLEKLSGLLVSNGKFNLGTMNGELSFKNDNNGNVVMKLYSGHSYHGFGTSISHNLEDFVEQFKRCLTEITKKVAL